MKRLLRIVSCLFLLASCREEPHYPTLVVEQKKAVVYNGETMQIVFSTDHPDHAVTPDNLRLLQIESATTSLSPDAPQGDLLRLSDVEPFRTPDGQSIPGKWIAVIEASAEQNCIGITRSRLQILRGGSAIATSDDIEVINVPALSDESAKVDVPRAVTYKIVPGESSTIEPYINPAYAFIPLTDMMLEARAMGVEWIVGLDAQILPGDYSDYVEVVKPPAGERQELGLYLTPVENLFSMLAPEDFPVEIEVAFTVTDLDGKAFTGTETISFYDYLVTAPASETGLDFVIGAQAQYHVNMAPYLARIGITDSYFADHPHASNPSLSFMTERSDGGDAVGVWVEEYAGDEPGWNNFKDPANYHVTVTDWLSSEWGDEGTYYGIIGVVMLDYRTMNLVIAARLRLEIIAR